MMHRHPKNGRPAVKLRQRPLNVRISIEAPPLAIQSRKREMPESELMTLEEFAERANVSLATVRHWRATKYGPKGARVGKRVMVKRADVEAWIEEQFQVGA